MPKGVFNGWWTDLAGNRLRRIRRSEYAELYRLLGLGRRLGLR